MEIKRIHYYSPIYGEGASVVVFNNVVTTPAVVSGYVAFNESVPRLLEILDQLLAEAGTSKANVLKVNIFYSGYRPGAAYGAVFNWLGTTRAAIAMYPLSDDDHPIAIQVEAAII